MTNTWTNTWNKSTMACLLCLWSCAMLPENSHAWVATSPTLSRTSRATSSSTTTLFYKTNSSAEEVAETMPKVIRTKKSLTSPSLLSTAKKLPWMRQGSDEFDLEAASDTVFLEHWNWQFSFFEETLGNLRVKNDDNEHVEIRDLYYAIKENKESSKNKQAPKQRVYTVSLESDEYRDIRMTYMHCPGKNMQTFRCLGYPRHGDLPILGMGIMKMGPDLKRNLAILDYQPLPPPTINGEEDEEARSINERYKCELQKLRQDFPSMNQPMTHQHFDSNEERKYFTDIPLLGRCNELDYEATDDVSTIQDYQRTLLSAQKEFVRKHTELTNEFTLSNSETSKRNYVLQRHSEFDTHVCEHEPAGPFLCSVFGPEQGQKLVHNVIFPLSQHGVMGQEMMKEAKK